MKVLLKSFPFLFCLLSFSQPVNAVSAYPHPINYKQPDGSVITITLQGDEYMNWAVSSDGYTLLSNKDGFYEYAVKNAAGDLVLSGIRARGENARNAEEKALLQQTPRKLFYSAMQIQQGARKAKSLQQSPSGIMLKRPMPVVGEWRLPIILVDFPDKPFTKDRAEYEALMNQEGYSQDKATGSVHDYFRASSYGQFDFRADVYGPYTLSQTIDYYDDSTTGGDPTRMAYEALRAVFNDGFDLSAYDLDNDGILDGAHIIFAGYGQEAGAPKGQSIWSHAWGTDLDFGDKQGANYSCSPELRGTSGNVLAPMGTIAHELGHVLGLPDLYDTDYEQSGGQCNAVVWWDVMASGSWNNSGDTPSYLSAWCKDFLGWVTAVELTEPVEITLPDPAEQGVIYRINTQTPNEYFLLENRQKQDWDTYVPGSGMLIYHVDENYAGWEDNTINANPSHPGLYVKTAGGSLRDSAPYPALDPEKPNTNFTDTSTPHSKSWAGQDTGKPVRGITRNTENKTISFKFRMDDESGYGKLQTVPTVNLYPNPISNGRLMVEISDSERETVQIYDLEGKQVLTGTAHRPKTEIDISHLLNGVYVVKAGGSVAKIVKW